MALPPVGGFACAAVDRSGCRELRMDQLLWRALAQEPAGVVLRCDDLRAGCEVELGRVAGREPEAMLGADLLAGGCVHRYRDLDAASGRAAAAGPDGPDRTGWVIAGEGRECAV